MSQHQLVRSGKAWRVGASVVCYGQRDSERRVMQGRSLVSVSIDLGCFDRVRAVDDLPDLLAAPATTAHPTPQNMRLR